MELACGISKEQIPQIASAFEIEIHRQKGEIVCNVKETESVVKLDAIEDGSRFRTEMNVIEMQIAMAIENPMLFNPLAK